MELRPERIAESAAVFPERSAAVRGDGFRVGWGTHRASDVRGDQLRLECDDPYSEAVMERPRDGVALAASEPFARVGLGARSVLLACRVERRRYRWVGARSHCPDARCEHLLARRQQRPVDRARAALGRFGDPREEGLQAVYAVDDQHEGPVARRRGAGSQQVTVVRGINLRGGGLEGLGGGARVVAVGLHRFGPEGADQRGGSLERSGHPEAEVAPCISRPQEHRCGDRQRGSRRPADQLVRDLGDGGRGRQGDDERHQECEARGGDISTQHSGVRQCEGAERANQHARPAPVGSERSDHEHHEPGERSQQVCREPVGHRPTEVGEEEQRKDREGGLQRPTSAIEADLDDPVGDGQHDRDADRPPQVRSLRITHVPTLSQTNASGRRKGVCAIARPLRLCLA